MDLHSRWTHAWQALGAAPDAGLLGKLLAAYREPQRHYHTLQHLEECFTHLELIGSSAEHPVEIELALWFHDAIYDTRRRDNEERSAQWAVQAISPLSEEAANRVHDLVMATRHEAVPEGLDAQILLDVDLSILGAEDDRFDEYEQQVRKEYGWVPGLIYRRKRSEILQGFLARPTIYTTQRFIERYEPRARANLARSLARL